MKTSTPILANLKYRYKHEIFGNTQQENVRKIQFFLTLYFIELRKCVEITQLKKISVFRRRH